MKSWMKFLVLGVALVAISVAWFAWGPDLQSYAVKGLGAFGVWIVLTLIAVASAMFGLCILYELTEQWYQRHSGGTSWLYDSWHKVRTWFGKDGF